MKKITSLLVVLMFALFLVACGGSNFPTVSESNKVTLTSEEAQEKISEIKEPEEKILKSAMKLKMEDKTMGFNAKINGTATGYQSDNELYFEVNVAGSSGSERASMGIKMYYINSMLYMNMTDKRAGQTESVKYKTNVSGLEEAMGSGVVGFSPAEFNEEIISNLFSTELIDADFDGLSYYEKDDEFSVKIELTNENIHSLPQNVRDVLMEYFIQGFSDIVGGVDSSSNFKHTLIITTKNGTIKTVGQKSIVTSSDMNVEVEMVMTFVDTMPRLTNLDSYEFLW